MKDDAGELQAETGAGAQLSERVALLGRLLARAEVGVYSVTADLSTVVYINPATEALFGRPAEEFRQNPGLWLAAIDPRDRPHIGDPLAELRQQGTARHIYRIVRPDGATLWVLDQSHRVDAESDRPAVFDCVFTDITRRMDVEAALRESEERFRKLAETAPLAIVLVTAAGDPLFTNDYARRLHGFPIDRLSRQQWLEMVDPRDRPAIAAALETGAPWEGVYRARDAAGELRWLLGSRVPLRDASGAVFAFLGTAVDVTAQCRAEEAQRASEANLTALIESTDDLIFSFDRELCFHTFNSAMAEYTRSVFGVELRSGRALATVFPAERAALWREMLTQVMARGRMTRDLQRADGRFVEVTLSPIQRDGQTVGTSVFTRDIEERRRAEQALRTLPGIVMRAQENERRAIANDLHDSALQDLSALKLFLQRSQKPAAAAGDVDKAAAIQRVDAIVQAVRDVTLRLRPFILDDLGLLPAVRSLASQVGTEAGVEIFVAGDALDDRLAPEVETAGFRIVQEAVTNACRHSKARAIHISLTRDGGMLRISVRDNGTGFDQPTSRDRAAADGHLGLSVMEERVTALRGTCSIRSESGMGTEILVRIPLGEPQSA